MDKMNPPSCSASDLAEDFDDLHFFPSPNRSSPPTMKNFISSASSLSSSGSSSSGIIGSNEELFESNDFTIGSRLNITGRRRGQYGNKDKEEASLTHINTSSSSRRPSNPSITRYPNSKERYVFSNFRFLVKEGSSLPKSVDESIDWLSVEMVLVPEIENVLCPICLDVPFIPRFTRCGHIYCLPCLLQYFQTSEPPSTSTNWRTCPVCSEPLHLKQLRPIKFCPATEPQEGEIFNSVLIKKPVGHLQPNLPKYSNDSINTLSPFQRLIPVNRSFVIEQILNPELNQLRSEIKKRKGEESLELSFYESTIKQIEADKEKEKDNVNVNVKNDMKKIDSSSSEFYYFHQSRDGLNVFLHPLCMKILKHHFESYESIPANLQLPILQLERVIVNSNNRKRFKYLDHLSMGTQIILVEVDLRSIVSPSTLKLHQKELLSRQGLRDQKLSRDHQKVKDKSILEEWKMMEDDYYSITQATIAMNIKVPESVKLDNLDDEESFPLPSSFNNNTNTNTSTNIRNIVKKQTTSDSSPSFSALAHSWNSPFTFNSTYSGDKDLSSNNKMSSPKVQSSAQSASAWNNEDSPTLSILSTSSTNSKKKIVLFSNGLNVQKK